ncbi:TetR/AcrR family transcriptional regulator [Rhodococcus sp. HM1]|uniref:TetR/AcrR family transcriptional regulator n=1 Tax=unclassified Rhodococcus (in: high G+C Gram-positive bacteria) TaxID=192944 RepID=UPI0018CE21BA|nr:MULTISPECIES: TetR/AcrR family transcriptional regulator [unclassified Rhodococcus (in: high G+C Gram-positive bacteria)]MBH0120980.1 TetR/AcrR family transcriptional regulator [Rhodococcus sp. CX]MCK8674042.1 TetR/AcrR family transcriptional regulator [Rhodococcus sp. HM1]
MRKHLLTSTHELLAKGPSARPTTTALAEHAHVSIGTVYRYFPDIDAIVEELRMSAVHDITTTLSTAIGRAMDQEPAVAMVTVVESLTAAFEKHAAVLRVSYTSGESEFGLAWAEVEGPLRPLGRIIPARLRPDLDDAALDDLVFIIMGATASLCSRIALLRPPKSDRDRLVAVATRMLLAAVEDA